MAQMHNIKIYDATKLPIPAEIIKEREQGRNKPPLSYVSGTVVIDYLNEIFDYCWSWTITGQWSDMAYPIYWKDQKTGEVKLSKEGKSHITHVKGILTAPVINPFTGEHIMVQKEAFGSKSTYETENEAVQESMYKAASTDALKKAASMFGIDGQLRRSPDELNFKENLHIEMYTDGKVWTPLSNTLHGTKLKKIFDVYQDSGKQMSEFFSELTEGKYMNVYPYNIEEIYQKVMSM